MTDVAIVGGGPAGAVLATLLARRGREVTLFERSPGYRWRACGVFSSPAAITALRAIGLDEQTLSRVARRVPAMRVESARGTAFRLTYGDDGSLRTAAAGFDRSELDPALLDLARAAGADVQTGASARLAGPGTIIARGPADGRETRARVVVGADGIHSMVARALGADRPARLERRTGLTFHIADPLPHESRDGRMVVFRGGYVGLAPIPGGRINVGIVLGRSWAARLRSEGAEAIAKEVLRKVPRLATDPVNWGEGERCDAIEGASPLGHRASRLAGQDWLLIGDAAGFLDPFTGEGLHRALVSARLAARAIERHLGGAAGGLVSYERAMRRRFRSKDALSLLVQGFLAWQPLFDHVARRLASRPDVRETMGLVMGDLQPASRVLDPRFVAAPLRP
jgi:menaquinone-9 beta-reductase